MPKGLQCEKRPAVVAGSVARAAPSALKEKQASPATNAFIERSALRSQDRSALTQRAVERLMATKTGATPHGVNVVETEEASEEGEEPREEAESESGELVEVQQKVPAKSEAKEPTERTDDPVRMYLREMGSVELLSREGEIAIAKRIEAGREAMIAGLCESPLTFQAIIIWRDELNEGKVFLRDIIDLEATYAGPDTKAMAAPVIGPNGQPIPPPSPIPGTPVLAQTPAPPPGAAPFKAAPLRADGEEGGVGES